MKQHQTSRIATVGVSATTLKWLKDTIKSGRYDSADPDNDNFESCIWDIENIDVEAEEWENFLTLLYVNTSITKDDISEYRYLDIYVVDYL